MASQLLEFPPATPLGPSPLLQNPLLQRPFLMQHVFLPTLYMALTPDAFRNRTRTKRFQNFLVKNNEVMDAINRNLTEIIKKNYRKKGKTYEVNNEERCKKMFSLEYSVTSAQESLLSLQKTWAHRMLNRRLGKEVEDLVQDMVTHIDLQKKSLDELRSNAVRVDKKDSRSRRSTPICREPFAPVGHECFYVAHEVKLPWHEAKDACQKLQGHLAEPDDPKILVRALKKMEGQFNRAWLGGSDEDEEGDWKWLSGETLIGSPYWRSGQPSNYSGKGDPQDCLVILRNTREEETPLVDFACSIERAYVCETEPEC